MTVYLPVAARDRLLVGTAWASHSICAFMRFAPFSLR